MNSHKIGDPVWVYDPNLRVYPRSTETGKSVGSPIYRESFRKFEITSESKTSWIVGRRDNDRVIAKISKNGKYSVGIMAFSEQELDDLCFINDNRHEISHHISTIIDASVLREVARVSGFTQRLIGLASPVVSQVASEISR